MAHQIQIEYFKTQYGELILGSYGDKLCLADWRYRKMRDAIDKRVQERLNASYVEGTSEVIQKTGLQLNQYFARERKEFDIPLRFVGTSFQKSVWDELMLIPYGKTVTYLELSRRLENEKAIRAVAAANGANAISIIVPCHRIMGSDGDPVGYAGGLRAKIKLLEFEGAIIKDQLSLF